MLQVFHCYVIKGSLFKKNIVKTYLESNTCQITQHERMRPNDAMTPLS